MIITPQNSRELTLSEYACQKRRLVEFAAEAICARAVGANRLRAAALAFGETERAIYVRAAQLADEIEQIEQAKQANSAQAGAKRRKHSHNRARWSELRAVRSI